MSNLPAGPVPEAEWYELVPFADGVTLIHEPWIKPFFRCNAWHVRGAERDLLVDSCLGHFSLRRNVPLFADKPVLAVASHSHFDHIGCHCEFADRCIHRAEAHILAQPRRDWTLADPYATDAMFIRPPQSWDAARYALRPAPPTELLADGDVIDLGDRRFEVIHTPGHSPGGIALWEAATGTLIAGDILYDGPLIDDTYHSDRRAYAESVRRLAALPARIVHGGHFPSFGGVRLRQLAEAYLTGAGANAA